MNLMGLLWEGFPISGWGKVNGQPPLSTLTRSRSRLSPLLSENNNFSLFFTKNGKEVQSLHQLAVITGPATESERSHLHSVERRNVAGQECTMTGWVLTFGHWGIIKSRNPGHLQHARGFADPPPPPPTHHPGGGETHPVPARLARCSN